MAKKPKVPQQYAGVADAKPNIQDLKIEPPSAPKGQVQPRAKVKD